MEIAESVKKACPDLTIESIEYLDEGDFCRAFLINKRLVFRFAKHDEARRSLMRENCLLPKIGGKLSLRIPQPRMFSFDENAEKSFLIYDFLPDESLTKETYLQFDEEKRAKCATDLAKFLNELHAIDTKIAVECGVRQIDYAAKYSHLSDRLRNDFRARFSKNDYEFAVSLIENYLASADSNSFQKVLLHGDLSPDHVLFNGEKVTAIIDFGDMMIGDAAWDFLWIYEDYGTDFFARALAKYNTADKKNFVSRVLHFSNLEAIQWIVDSLELGAEDLNEAFENLRDLQETPKKLSSIFENLLGNLH